MEAPARAKAIVFMAATTGRSLTASWPALAVWALGLGWPLWIRRVLHARSAPGLYAEELGPVLYLGDLLAIAFVLLTLRRRGAAQAAAAWRRSRPAALPLAALALLSALSAAWSLEPAVSLWTALRLSVLLLVVLGLTGWPRAGRWLMAPMALVLGLEAATGVAQFLGQAPLDWRWAGELALHPDLSGAAVLQRGEERILRGYGLTQHPNILGGYLAVGALLLLPRLSRRWARALAPLLGLGLWVAYSRAAWLALAATAGALAVRHLARRTLTRSALPLVAVGLVALAGVLSRPDLLRPRLGLARAPLEVRAVEERALLGGVALELLRRHPLGVGAGAYSQAVRTTYGSGQPYLIEPAHDLPLLVGAELGWVGLAAVLALLVWPPVALLRQGRSERAAPLVALIPLALLDHYLWTAPTALLFWALALGLSLGPSPGAPGSPTGSPARPPGLPSGVPQDRSPHRERASR